MAVQVTVVGPSGQNALGWWEQATATSALSSLTMVPVAEPSPITRPIELDKVPDSEKGWTRWAPAGRR